MEIPSTRDVITKRYAGRRRVFWKFFTLVTRETSWRAESSFGHGSKCKLSDIYFNGGIENTTTSLYTCKLMCLHIITRIIW